MRRTEQRSAIEAVLEDAGRPLSVEEIHGAASAVVASLGLATVYRNVRRLVDEGLLETVELPGESPRYELRGKPHHHHFRCRHCDRVFDIEKCPPALEKMLPRGFELEAHEIVLYGRCQACREASGARRKSPPGRLARR